MHSGLKWFARIAGLVISAFFLAFFVGEGIPDLVRGYGGQLSFFMLFCLPCFIGFIIAWSKPYAGGIIMIIGSLLLGSYFVYFADFSMAMVFGIPALLIGLSFIASVHKELV